MWVAGNGVPGPVHLSLAADMLQTEVEEATLPRSLECRRLRPMDLPSKLIERAVDLLAGAVTAGNRR